MINKFLNYLHQNGFQNLLVRVSQLAYFVKGYGFVESMYHRAYRAYSFKVGGMVYLSAGPGWASSFEYLLNSLRQSFCFMYTPQPGDCVIDIGAGLGEESVVYAKLVGKRGKLISIEANRVTFEGLNFLIKENKYTWALPLQVAVFNKDEEVSIEDDEDNYLINTINVKKSEKNSILVKAQKLDTLVKEQGIERIDFLKSNIEGAEQFLIEGMDESIHLIRHLCISCHDFRHIYHNHGEFYMTKDKVVDFLSRHGFEITIRKTGNRVVDDYIYATNPKLK